MIQFSGEGILLDIEGTTSSISFVYDVMFPFVRRELQPFLSTNWGEASLQEACDLIAVDTGRSSVADWCGEISVLEQQAIVQQEVERLMDGDVKATGLKRLQGLIWAQGFESGELKAHLYDDVAEQISNWRDAGKSVRIYSSGSVQAQKLFFGHTIHGNLLSHFDGHYDTTIGAKRESTSYQAIASEFNLPAEQILFVSDVIEELDAARNAGMATGLCVRPGNPEISDANGHAKITSFAQIELN